eukprot:g2268.t1
MSYRENFLSVWLANLPDSLNKARESFSRHFREFAAALGWSDYDIRVPYPVTPSPQLFTSLGLLLTTLRECGFHVPEGTLTVSMIQFIVFLEPEGVSLAKVGLHPRHVIKRKEYYRLITSAFTHLDAPHLLYNLSAFIECGNILEKQMGVVPFVVEVTLLTLLSHGLYVLFAWIEHKTLERSSLYYGYGIGFSCVIFAFSTITGMVHADDPTTESSLPFLPVCYHVWAHLVVTQILFPEVSFFGHLIGISAGLIRVFCPGPFLWIRRKFTSAIEYATQQRLCNRMDDERRLASGRTKFRFVHHLWLLGAAWLWYFVEMKR